MSRMLTLAVEKSKTTVKDMHAWRRHGVAAEAERQLAYKGRYRGNISRPWQRTYIPGLTHII